MQISEFAARCGVTVHALRHYEALGLLKPGRSAGGYRTYEPAQRDFILFRRGYAGFRMYAKTIDQVDGLRRRFHSVSLIG